jgi:apolipoprotein N-acyltransferase
MIAAMRRNLPAVFLGGGAALGHAPVSFWPATIVCTCAFFIWILSRTIDGKIRASVRFWAFGLGYFGITLSWIVEPFLVEAAIHGWMAPFALFFMAGGMAIFWAIGGVAFVFGGPWAAIGAIIVGEWLRGHVLTGFPWGMPAYTMVDTAAIWWFGSVGPYGVSFFIFAISVALAKAVLRPAAATIACAITLGGLMSLPIVWRQAPVLDAGQTLTTVRLVQPNAIQSQKWDPKFAPIFYQRLLDATKQTPRPDLIIWPESAIAALLNYAPDLVDDITAAAEGTPIIFGALRIDDDDRLKNSLVLLDNDGQSTLYDKSHLVPFGEYLPLEPLLRPLGLGFFYDLFGGAFTPGDGPTILRLPNGQGIVPLICYELIFPDVVRSVPDHPDMIVQITNDAWFGTRSGPYQHMAQARARAVENGVSVVRVANTGISGVIGPDGTVVDALDLGVQGAIDVAVPKPHDPTLYRQYGDLSVLFMLIIAFFASLRARGRNNLLTSL